MKRLNISQMMWGIGEVEVQESVKDLGVMIDSTLSFKGQINQTVKMVGYHHQQEDKKGKGCMSVPSY